MIKLSYIYDAITYAIDNTVTIINIRGSEYILDSIIDQLIEEAENKNIPIVSSAGDYGEKDLLYPSSNDKVFAITAIDKNGKYGLIQILQTKRCINFRR